MSGAIPPLPQYAFMAWCLVKAQGQLYLLPFPLQENIPNYLLQILLTVNKNSSIITNLYNATDCQIVNQGEQQECPLSPTLLNIYMNEMIFRWNQCTQIELK
jgi:hypothetical protein